MKKLFIGTSLFLGLSPAVHAQNHEGQFAVLKTEKACDINVPAGLSKSQVYFSKDCSTAYILPAQVMKGVVTEPVYLAGSDENMCTAFYEQNKVRAGYQQRIDALNQLIEKALLSETSNEEDRKNIAFKIKEIKKQVTYYQKQSTEAVSSFDKMAAMRVKFTLANGIMDSVLSFQAANIIPGTTQDVVYPVRIMPAQIVDSMLAVSNPDSENYQGRMVTKVSFPGQLAKIDDRFRDPTTTYTSMNGALSGIVDISTSAYCTNLKTAKVQSELVSRSVAFNMYYNVKVQTGVKLYVGATIQTKDFLRQLSNMKLKAKYERRDFTNDLIMGGLKGSIKIVIDDKGETRDFQNLINDPDNSPIARLISGVISKYLDRVQDKLEQLGVFVKGEAPRAKEVENGTENIQTGWSQVCRRNSGFFGIGASSSCSRQPIYIQVDQAGISRLIQEQQDNSYITEEVSYETNETQTVPHSSTFSF